MYVELSLDQKSRERDPISLTATRLITTTDIGGFGRPTQGPSHPNVKSIKPINDLVEVRGTFPSAPPSI